MLLGGSLLARLAGCRFLIQHIVAAHAYQRKGVLDEQKDAQKDMVSIQAVFHHHFGMGIALCQLLDLLAAHLAVAQFRVNPERVLRRYPGGSPAHHTHQPGIFVPIHKRLILLALQRDAFG